MKLLGIEIHSLKKTELETKIREILQTKKTKFHQIATINPEFLVESTKNQKFREILQTKTWLNLCDGFGIKFIFKLLYKKSIQKISGVEVAEILCKICEQENKKIYFLGGFRVGKKASESILKKYKNLKIVGIKDEFSRKDFSQTKPDVVLVCQSFPQQEIFIDKEISEIPSVKVAGGFGGTFDFWSGKISRSPKFLQNIGFEWLWRFFQEPKKRFTRIFKAVFVFPFLVIREFMKN